MEWRHTRSLWAAALAAAVGAACATGGNDGSGTSYEGGAGDDGGGSDASSGGSSGSTGSSSGSAGDGSTGSSSGGSASSSSGSSSGGAGSSSGGGSGSSSGGGKKDAGMDAASCTGCTTGESCCGGTCTPTNTTSNCSGCGITCDTKHSTGDTCNGTTCAYTGCNSGYADCTTAAPDSDGCETDVNTTVTSCGACTRGCSSANVASLSCSGGKCNSTCKAGWGNCSEPTAPNPDDGCESNLNTCVGTPCCTAGVCQGKHHNGLGDTYNDCAPLGTPGNASTYSATMAKEAATAWPNPGGTGTISSGTCTELTTGKLDSCEANRSSTACSVWCYTGIMAGYVHENTASGKCLCPDSMGTSWN
jgi:hypothetical protein